MIYLNGIVLLIFVIGYVCTKNYKKEELQKIDISQHKLWMFYPTCHFLIERTLLKKVVKKQRKQKEQLKALFPGEDMEQLQKVYFCRKLSFIGGILLAFNIFSLVIGCKEVGEKLLVDGKYIYRLEAGEGTQEVPLHMSIDHPEGSIGDNIIVSVQEKTYTEEELEIKWEEAKTYIKVNYLGRNEKADEVRTELNFIKRIPDSQIQVNWEGSFDGLVEADGMINNQDMQEEDGQETIVKATLQYGKKEEKMEFTITIFPKIYTLREQLKNEFEKSLFKAEEQLSKEEKMELPDNVDDYSISYQEKKENYACLIWGLGMIVVVLLWLFTDKELEKKTKKRELQMMVDYPELIHKFVLLLGAGMTVKSAWGKVAKEYRIKREALKTEKRYAYEEWLMTWYELNNGVSEVTALEQFGHRVKLLSYIKFTSLVAQNMRKGSKGLLALLEYEARDAFQERKELAKRLGEEAGTKLLAPMMIMLIVVLAIIMLPAMMSF